MVALVAPIPLPLPLPLLPPSNKEDLAAAITEHTVSPGRSIELYAVMAARQDDVLLLVLIIGGYKCEEEEEGEEEVRTATRLATTRLAAHLFCCMEGGGGGWEGRQAVRGELMRRPSPGQRPLGWECWVVWW